MPSYSPPADGYDDDFDSPTPSERDGVRPPSLSVTPSPYPQHSHNDQYSPMHSDDNLPPPSHTPGVRSYSTKFSLRYGAETSVLRSANAGHNSEDNIEKVSRNGSAASHFSRQLSRNQSRVSQFTYNADDANYEDDFDRDDDFHSERSYTPDSQKDVHRKDEPFHAIPESPRDYQPNSYVGNANFNKGFSGSTASVRRIQNGSKISMAAKSTYAGSSRKLGSRTHTTLSMASKRLPYSNRKSVRSMRNGPSRMSVAPQLDVNDLRHEIHAIADEIETLTIENKVLKRNNVLLNHQLEKREKEEEQIPNLYDRQVKELRVLKDQLRRQQERYDKVHYRLRRAEKNLAISEREENGLEKRAEECELKERSRLRKQLERVEQENRICDEKIAQMERYVENLEKCHESEMALEVEKQKESQAELDRLLQQTEMVKQNMQAKEAELEKFRIQRPSRMAMSRAMMNTSMSGHMASIAEAPANHASQSDSNRSTNNSRGQLKALPAPPVKPNFNQLTPVKPSTDTHHASKEAVKLTPSPPTTSRNNPRSGRPSKTKPLQPDGGRAAVKLAATEDKTPSNAISVGEKNKIEDEIKRSIDEEKRAELMRTNMALNQSMRVQKVKQTSYTQPTVPGETPQPVREDSWTATRAAQSKTTTTNSQFGSSVSVSRSVREQTFAIVKATSSNPHDGSNQSKEPSNAEKRLQEVESLQKKEALLKDMREAEEKNAQKSSFTNSKDRPSDLSFNNPTRLDSNAAANSVMAKNEHNTLFREYEPSTRQRNSDDVFGSSPRGSHIQVASNLGSDASFTGSPWESGGRKTVDRKRETTIMSRKKTITSVFGDDLDELNL